MKKIIGLAIAVAFGLSACSNLDHKTAHAQTKYRSNGQTNYLIHFAQPFGLNYSVSTI